jgi:general secretion pathway protein E
MISPTAADPLPYLATIEPDQRAMIDEAPRQNRLPLLAQLKSASPRRRSCCELAREAGLEVREDFDLPDAAAGNPPASGSCTSTSACLSPMATTADDTRSPLVTVWPPTREMDEWIHAVSGKGAQVAPRPGQPYQRHHYPALRRRCRLPQRIGHRHRGSRPPEETEEDENAALIRFVNEVIAKAIDDRATDIHFEPLKESLQIRYRIDGELVPIRVPDNLIRFQGAIISRLKIMAKLNISEKRRPQDGRIVYKGKGTELDIRISTMPTMYGESISLRLLNQKNQPLSMEELGMLKDDQTASSGCSTCPTASSS